MDSGTLRWLISQLGPDTDPVDLAQRYDQLGSARAVAGEVLSERIAALLSEPLRVTVNGVATIDHSANVAALERRLNQLDTQTAPDDPVPGMPETLVSVPLTSRPRR
ncbi:MULTISPECIES: hypothetical protein [unclassified Streptomyces]|uniref:hypothetical protein n=1 Tax=unclassified Streptomyces TaxID=2593676 RepID=UPI0022708B13|nr:MULTISPECIES: hypothetical protein [unclassified Streptomyces]MCY0922578.1 hypothetical protein [Streptomyces sp. H27-G5]MCY0961615.1 hypothetical protein [Streptomyces sp. H27-H5]